MKTRVTVVPAQTFCLNPLNGWDAEVPDELYTEYFAAVRKLHDLQLQLIEVLQPQAVAADRAYDEYMNKNGLTLVGLPSGEGTCE